jgi:hypothetical protein
MEELTQTTLPVLPLPGGDLPDADFDRFLAGLPGSTIPDSVSGEGPTRHG